MEYGPCAITVQQSANNMYLRVDDGANHLGNSNTFNVFSKTPVMPDLLPGSDSGMSTTDNITNRDNSNAAKNLQFSVRDTIAGATVTIYADNVAIGMRRSCRRQHGCHN